MNDSMNAMHRNLYLLLNNFVVSNVDYLLSVCTVVSVKSSCLSHARIVVLETLSPYFCLTILAMSLVE